MIRMPRYERRNEKNNRTRPSSIYFLFSFFVYSVQLHGGESVELIFHSASFSPSFFFFCSRLFYFRVSFLILIKVTFSSIDISARMLKLARIESVR